MTTNEQSLSCYRVHILKENMQMKQAMNAQLNSSYYTKLSLCRCCYML